MTKNTWQNGQTRKKITKKRFKMGRLKNKCQNIMSKWAD